ncbi:MAG: hypothetical protein SGI92_30870 [Bryobacteraceae bacterium]|nr:hypothetical protein [Bryobacteraceae bacterium]
MKAGMMEIADLFLLNKWDLPGAERAAGDLEAAAGRKTGNPLLRRNRDRNRRGCRRGSQRPRDVAARRRDPWSVTEEWMKGATQR